MTGKRRVVSLNIFVLTVRCDVNRDFPIEWSWVVDTRFGTSAKMREHKSHIRCGHEDIEKKKIVLSL